MTPKASSRRSSSGPRQNASTTVTVAAAARTAVITVPWDQPAEIVALVPCWPSRPDSSTRLTTTSPSEHSRAGSERPGGAVAEAGERGQTLEQADPGGDRGHHQRPAPAAGHPAGQGDRCQQDDEGPAQPAEHQHREVEEPPPPPPAGDGDDHHEPEDGEMPLGVGDVGVDLEVGDREVQGGEEAAHPQRGDRRLESPGQDEEGREDLQGEADRVEEERRARQPGCASAATSRGRVW